MPKVPQVTNPESAGVPMLDLNGGGGANLPLYTQVEPSANYWFLYPPWTVSTYWGFAGFGAGPRKYAHIAYIPAGKQLNVAIYADGNYNVILGVYDNQQGYPGNKLWDSGVQVTVANGPTAFNTGLSFSTARAIWLVFAYQSSVGVMSALPPIWHRVYMTSGANFRPEMALGPIDDPFSMPAVFPSGHGFSSSYIIPLIFQRWT